MTDEQFNKMMTLLVAIYEELHELNNPSPVDFSELEAMGFEIEVANGGADD